MKNTRINLIATVALAIIFASCSGLSKMKKKASDVKYTVTPEVLETHGGKVDVTIKVQIPEKYFNKKVALEATPALVYDGGETAFEPYRMQGEDVEGNDKVISYQNGGSLTYTGSVPYNKNMRISDLVVKIKGSKGDKTEEFDPYVIAQGVISTPTLVMDMGAKAVIGADHFQRIIPEERTAEIFFIIQRANLRGTELKKEEIKKLNDYIKDVKAAQNKEFKKVDVSAYASPDGPMDLNTKLAEQREKNTQKYLTKELKKAKVDEASDKSFFDVKSTPEDWEGFKQLMEKSNIQDKELILRVLSMYSDPEVREREIKNMSATFKILAEDILPKLRRSKMSVNVDVIGKSDEEISDLAANNPTELNIEELLYAATLTKNVDEQLSIYKAAANKYPNCWRAENNVGVALYKKGDLNGAKAAFEKANSLKSGVPEINNNLGVIALREGDIAKAEEYFGNAAGAGPELDNNLGIVAIHKGDYDAAVRYFGNAANCNAALAKILAGKYDSALSTLNAIPHEAGLKYYLKAIIGAETDDSDMMFEGLRKATELDSKYKKLAATDMVFAKYFEDATFKSIVQ